jgi:hypothetical protein
METTRACLHTLEGPNFCFRIDLIDLLSSEERIPTRYSRINIPFDILRKA